MQKDANQKEGDSLRFFGINIPKWAVQDKKKFQRVIVLLIAIMVVIDGPIIYNMFISDYKPSNPQSPPPTLDQPHSPRTETRVQEIRENFTIDIKVGSEYSYLARDVVAPVTVQNNLGVPYNLTIFWRKPGSDGQHNTKTIQCSEKCINYETESRPIHFKKDGIWRLVVIVDYTQQDKEYRVNKTKLVYVKPPARVF